MDSNHTLCNATRHTELHGFKTFFEILHTKCPEGQLLRIEMILCIVSLFLPFLFLYGGIRQRIRTRMLHLFMKGVYVLVPVGITYVMGLMHNASEIHDLFPVWALFIIYGYGGVDTMTAYNLNDHEQVLKYWLQTFTFFFWASWLFNQNTSTARQDAMFYPLLVLYLIALWNGNETLQAFKKASKSTGLPKAIWPIVEHMRYNRTTAATTPHSNDMTSYRYLVWGDKPRMIRSWYSCGLPTKEAFYAKDKTTIDQIWDSEVVLLQSTDGTSDIRDTCLSFALSKLLLTRFAGYTLDPNSVENIKEFVGKELLWEDPKQPDHFDRVFRILELELEFVFDFFYTKLYILSNRTFTQKLMRLGFIGCFLLYAFYGLHHSSPKINNRSLFVHGHAVEIGVTRAYSLVIAALEFWQIAMHMLSNWKIVEHVCKYDKNPKSSPDWRQTEIRWVWTTRNFLSKHTFLSFFYKPWRRKLGQYSLIKSCKEVPLMRKIGKKLKLDSLVRIPNVGETGEFSVKLSQQVKKAIILSLVRNGLGLTPGTTTLGGHGLSKLSDACKLESNAEVILVWHIATSAYGFFHKDENNDNFLVATQLSNYCAYLVTFVSDLLPDQPYSTQNVFNNAVKESFIDSDTDLDCRYKMLMNTKEDKGSVFDKGATLAKELDKVIPSEGWLVLSEFWAELLLYMALSNKETIHGEYLAKGGEFITHLWALLVHADAVIDRNSCPTTSSNV